MKGTKGVKVSYAEVRKLVDAASNDSATVKAIDHLFSAALIVSPIVLGPASAPLIALFDLKSDLIARASDAARSLAGAKGDFLTRSKCLAAANWLSTYAAFFAAAQRLIPEIFDAAELTDEEKTKLIERASGEAALPPTSTRVGDATRPPDAMNCLAPIDLPNPVIGLSAEFKLREELYLKMSKELLSHVQGLRVYEELNETERDAFNVRIIERLPKDAVSEYLAQYVAMMIDHKDYFTWAMAQTQFQIRASIDALSSDSQSAATAVLDAVSGIDLGMHRLADAIAAVGRDVIKDMTDRSLEVATHLQVAHEDRILEPIIRDVYDDGSGEANLVYPTRADAFVPQAFKALRYVKRSTDLENEIMWSELEPQDDISGFLLSYLESPTSAEAPLVVLGHPGSGKSLFTDILAARLAPPAFSVVRIELRDVNPETEIQTQIEKQIRRDTGRDIDWPDYCESMPESPPIIILDGYDELLQASGRVFSTYLEAVHQFQQREMRYDRPVRIIVSSRITLIGKAAIPEGSGVLRLLEFDETRRNKWISVWNETNSAYFKASNVTPFSLSDDPRIIELAEQPLLLLMLAIYDSDENSLGKSDVSQTFLYDRLLRRFMVRERSKGEDGSGFNALSTSDRQQIIDRDLYRLGVAAIGMYNRESVHIHADELTQDIEYFDASRPIEVSTGVALTQADLLLGSFFFIHESRSRISPDQASDDDESDERDSASAFEFLHNTFGEFLAADFIITQIIEQAGVVAALRSNVRLSGNLQHELSGPQDHWFSCLAYTGLHTRPVIVSMMREWLPQKVSLSSTTIDDVIQCIGLLIERQLLDIAAAEPPIWLNTARTRSPYRSLAFLGHIAVYSLNIVILNVSILQQRFAFRAYGDSNQSGDGGVPHWERLQSLWRGWFPPETLATAADLFVTSHIPDGVVVAPAAGVVSSSSGNSALRTARMTSLAIGDRLLYGATSLLDFELGNVSADTLDEIQAVLESVGVPVADHMSVLKAKYLHDEADPDQLTSLMVKTSADTVSMPASVLGSLEVASNIIGRGMLPYRLRVPGPESRSAVGWFSPYQADLMFDVKSKLEPLWLEDSLRRSEADLSSPFMVACLRQLRRFGAQGLAQYLLARDEPRADDSGRNLEDESILRTASSTNALEGLLELLCCTVGDEGSKFTSEIDKRAASIVRSWKSLRSVPEETMAWLFLEFFTKRIPSKFVDRIAELAPSRAMRSVPLGIFWLCAIVNVNVLESSPDIPQRGEGGLPFWYWPSWCRVLLRWARVNDDPVRLQMLFDIAPVRVERWAFRRPGQDDTRRGHYKKVRFDTNEDADVEWLKARTRAGFPNQTAEAIQHLLASPGPLLGER